MTPGAAPSSGAASSDRPATDGFRRSHAMLSFVSILCNAEMSGGCVFLAALLWKGDK
jgi:hypothetical protein